MVLVSSSHGKKESSDDGTVVDYRGNPVIDKSRTGGWLAAGLILGGYFISFSSLSKN